MREQNEWLGAENQRLCDKVNALSDQGKENVQLRDLLLTMLRTIKEVELTLQKALDEDSH